MKLKDFFTKLGTDGKIAAPEFVAFKDTVPDFEIPDKAVEAFEASFLTPDRAATDKAINGKARREAYDAIDRDIHELVDFGLKEYVQHQDKRIDALKKEGNTHEKIKLLTSIVEDSFKRVKTPGGDEDTKKKLKEKEEAVTDLMARIEKMNKEYSEKEKFFETDYQKKITDFKLGGELEKLANSFKFGKAYSDDTIRKDITKGKLDNIRASNSLSLVETDGQTVIQVLDKEGKPRFNGNSAVTINQLLEDAFKPYIKANNTGDEDTDEPERQETKRFAVPDGQPKIRQGARTTVQ